MTRLRRVAFGLPLTIRFSGQPPVPPGDASRGVKNGVGSPADADVFLGV